MATTQNLTAGQRRVIAADGDIVLQVGKPDSSQVEIVVSSRSLSISPIFKEMLSKPWYENPPTHDLPQEIALPEDEPDSIHLLCILLHDSIFDPTKDLTCTQLANLAVVCRKYGGLDKCRFWVHFWLSRLIPKINDNDDDDSERLIFVAYVFDLSKEFYDITQAILKVKTFKIKISVATHGQQAVPMKVFDHLHEAELKLHAQVVSSLLFHHTVSTNTCTCRDGLTKFLTRTEPDANPFKQIPPNDCKAYELASLHFFQAMIHGGLGPTKMNTLRGYRKAVANMRSFEGDLCDSNHCLCRSVVETRDCMLKHIDRVGAGVKGLCIDCVHKEEDGIARHCRSDGHR